mmetsp:Transcript_2310/g.5201  ORF Transcript_2310/g.5201 Transcript_2310/m.5201 type:complete len:535 (-) Transcript_2310:170-1774(-)
MEHRQMMWQEWIHLLAVRMMVILETRISPQLLVLVLVPRPQDRKLQLQKKRRTKDYNPFFINVSEIALHWELEGSPRIMQLLTEMANNPLPDKKKSTVSVLPAFQSDKEFVYFHHIMKTGGTSFSEVLNKIYGSGARDNSVNDSGDFDVLPKSRSSEFMDFTGLKNIIDHKQQSSFSSNNTRPHHNFRFLVGYSHSGYNPVAKFLQENNLVKTYDAKYYLENETSNITQSQRRLRLITFIRDPLDIRASSMAMAMCGLNGLLRKKNITSPNCGQEVNISEIVDFGLEQVKLECKKTSGNKMVRRGGLHATCEKLEKGIDPKPYCRSANALLHSETYNKWCSNIMEDVVDEYIKDGPVHKMEEYALKTFGKPLLPSLSSVTGFTSNNTNREELHDAGIPPRDYIFFGITERMKDTMCLFFYTFRASPPKEVLQEGDLSLKRRVMSCKTNSWWTPKDRAIVHEREKPDYAMWRSANVVMDIWLERVRREIIDTFFDGNMKAADMDMSLDKNKQRERKVLPDYIAPGCFGLSDRGKI